MKEILKHTRLLVIIFLFFVFVVLINSLIYFKNDELKVVFLDVGQGDSIFIEFPDKTQILVDAGRNARVLRELNKVMPFWDNSIDYVLETHPDADHIGGFIDILSRYKIEYLIKTDVATSNKIAGQIDILAKDKGVETLKAFAGMTISARDSYFKILFPDTDVGGFETNTASIVAKVFSKDGSYILTGDSPIVTEKYLVYKFGDYLKSNVLKLGHHGSRTSSSKEFLETVNPQVAIISAGKNNSYGHPHKEVLDLLDDLQIKYLYTWNGSLFF